MASVADTIPPALLVASRKEAVIEFIRETALPSRFRRKLLQDWGEAVKVDLSAEDYAAVTATGR